MNDLFLSDGLRHIADTPGPAAPSIAELVTAGRQARRAQQHRRVGAGVGGVAVLAAAAVVVTSAVSAPLHGATTIGPAGQAQDEPLTWTYWESSYVDTGYVMKDSAPVETVQPPQTRWDGNGRPAVEAQGPPGAPTEVSVLPSSTPTAHWQQLWSAPRDPAALLTWMKDDERSLPQDATCHPVACPSPAPDRPITIDATDVWQFLAGPAPTSLRLAFDQVIQDLPRSTTTQGVDALGRDAVITHQVQSDPRAETWTSYTDPVTGELLETQVFAGAAGSPISLPLGHLYYQDVYDHYGPATTVPAATPRRTGGGTIPPNTTGTPTCTPGTPVSSSDANEIVLDRICLPDPVAGFTRTQPDDYGDDVGRGWYLSDGSNGVLLQIATDNQFDLSLAQTPKPKNGKVGVDTYVGDRSVLGVTASEVVDSEGNHGLVLSKGGLGIEVMGGKTSSYAGLAALADQLQGLPS